jgi:hypothetical protein
MKVLAGAAGLAVFHVLLQQAAVMEPEGSTGPS